MFKIIQNILFIGFSLSDMGTTTFQAFELRDLSKHLGQWMVRGLDFGQKD